MPAGKGVEKLERELAKMETGIEQEKHAIANVLKAIERDPSPLLSTRLREVQAQLAESEAAPLTGVNDDLDHRDADAGGYSGSCATGA